MLKITLCALALGSHSELLLGGKPHAIIVELK
jgi:hypothetical protein